MKSEKINPTILERHWRDFRFDEDGNEGEVYVVERYYVNEKGNEVIISENRMEFNY